MQALIYQIVIIPVYIYICRGLGLFCSLHTLHGGILRNHAVKFLRVLQVTTYLFFVMFSNESKERKKKERKSVANTDKHAADVQRFIPLWRLVGLPS